MRKPIYKEQMKKVKVSEEILCDICQQKIDDKKGYYMETTDNKILDKIEDIFEHIKIIIEDSIIRDSELEVCFRALDIALERSQECGLLKTQLEIANRRMEEVVWKHIDEEEPEDNRECYIAIQSNITHEIYVEGARYDKGKWVLEIPRYYDDILDSDEETVLAWQYKKIPKFYGEWRKE